MFIQNIVGVVDITKTIRHQPFNLKGGLWFYIIASVFGITETITVKCENCNEPELVQAFLKKNGGLNQILKRQTYRFHYGSKFRLSL